MASSDGRLKFVQDRIGKVEKHFGKICQSIAAYLRTLSKLREKGDDVVGAMMAYAENESLNHTTKAALIDFVDNFSAVEDFRNIQIHRLDNKIIEPMSQYGKSCRKAQERVKDAFAASAKELKLKSAPSKSTSKTGKDQAPQTQKTTSDAFKANRELEDELDSFERKKLHDVKALMTDFVSVELSFHAKALEMFTLCYRSMTLIREDHDLQQFRESLRPLVRRSNQSDRLPNASNSASAGTSQRTPRFLEAIGKQLRRGRKGKNRSCTESTSGSSSQSQFTRTSQGSPSSSHSKYTESSQNGATADGGMNDSGEDDAETEEYSADEEKPRRN